jgi:hypothetical protein
MRRSTVGRALLATIALTTSSLALGVSPALAAPTGEFAIFADCPLSTPELFACFVARIGSGSITVGRETVPITHTLTIQGGLINEQAEESGGPTHQKFVGAADGDTLPKVAQSVPGGLSGLVGCHEIANWLARALCERTVANGTSGLTATTELAGPASSISMKIANLLLESGTGISLPVKIKLENPFLGNACYIGSDSHPLTLDLTTGTTNPPAPGKPIKGKFGLLSKAGEGEILYLPGNLFVDNAFPAPAASGCGASLSALIDPIIDSKIGLPSAAGKNTAILSGAIDLVSPENLEEEHP